MIVHLVRTILSLNVFILPALAFLSLPPPFCFSQSQPNPIGAEYPRDITGTINGTVGIIPIDYSTARSLVPAQYGILKDAYLSLLPGFPEDKYPMFIQSVLDHDIRNRNIRFIPDFMRTSFSIPFVDRLNDGHTSFRATLPMLLSLNPVALVGAGVYGPARAGTFDPPCDPYAFAEESGAGTAERYVNAYAGADQVLGQRPSFAMRWRDVPDLAYPMEFYKNITNQPVFGTTSSKCNHYVQLFNASVTTEANAPVPIRGTISARPPYYPSDMTFTDVAGLRLDSAFIEHNVVDCESLRGYSGTGEGD